MKAVTIDEEVLIYVFSNPMTVRYIFYLKNYLLNDQINLFKMQIKMVDHILISNFKILK